MPARSGMAFVVIFHLDPTQKSLTPEILQKDTAMRVVEAREGADVEQDCVYVIPPNKMLSIRLGKLRMTSPAEPRGHRLPVDFFLKSLAIDQNTRSVGIIFSGSDTDGTQGIRAIKELGGFTMAQEESTAQYGGMPHNAIATGMVDRVLPVEKMPDVLVEHARKRTPALTVEEEVLRKEDFSSQLGAVFALLRTRTGHDFSGYKRSTLVRRLERRMHLLRHKDLPEYIDYMRSNVQEAEFLVKELLIGVTNFFREPKVFAMLRSKIIPKLLQKHSTGGSLRVWVPGCATGEEAYSIAILLVERMMELKENFRIQIFATDIHEDALATARSGLYPESIASEVSVDRLKWFFTKEGNGYRISKQIRDMMVFAIHDLVRDAPFSRLDFISCRNVMIYLNKDLQKKLIPLFHYTLKPDGYLMLGTSESIGDFADMFTAVDAKMKVYHRRPAARRVEPVYPLLPSFQPLRQNSRSADPAHSGDLSVGALAEKNIVSRLAPTWIVVNENHDILHFSEKTSAFLEPAGGMASLNLLKMAREGLRLDLRAAIHRCLKTRKDVTVDGVKMKKNGHIATVRILVSPLGETESLEGLALVLFEEIAPPVKGAKKQVLPKNDPVLVHLESELKEAKEQLQMMIEEFETSNEELRSSNEELSSMNEELQSSNEELSTSKEELQSLNEEMSMMNQELESKVEELSRSNNDMHNLLSSTDIATIFLDGNLRIKRFTAPAAKILPLLPTDVGRPIQDLAQNILYENLPRDAESVLRLLVPQEKILRARDNCWYVMRIMPYRTIENVIEGVVVTFTDVTTLRKTEDSLRGSLQGKELLLREIHHRVKNNLQIVTSFLRIRSADLKDARAQAILADCQNLLRSIAIIHEKLLKTGEIRDVKFGEFADNIVGELRLAKGQGSAAIEVACSGTDVLLDLDTAIPCAMILNELVTNAIRHAFTAGGKGMIRLDLQEINDDELEMLVEDNGVGLPAGVNFNNEKYFGLQLVKMLVASQLHGQVEIESVKRGTRFAIRFRRQAKKAGG